MSQENVEVVRQALAALDRRDVEAYLEVASPQIELITPALPVQGLITGHEGIRDFFRDMRSLSEASEFQVEEIRAGHGAAGPSLSRSHSASAARDTLGTRPRGAISNTADYQRF